MPTFDEVAEWLADNLDLVPAKRHRFVKEMAAATWSPSDRQEEFLFDLYDEAKERAANAEG